MGLSSHGALSEGAGWPSHMVRADGRMIRSLPTPCCCDANTSLLRGGDQRNFAGDLATCLNMFMRRHITMARIDDGATLGVHLSNATLISQKLSLQRRDTSVYTLGHRRHFCLAAWRVVSSLLSDTCLIVLVHME